MWVFVLVSGLGGIGGVRVSVYSGLGGGGEGDTKAGLYAPAGLPERTSFASPGCGQKPVAGSKKEELRSDRYTPVSARHGGLLTASS